MNSSDRRSLEELARLAGVQTSFRNMAGATEQAAPETLTAILKALGFHLSGPDALSGALRQAQIAHWKQALEPVVVSWDGQPLKIPVRVEQPESDQRIMGRLELEDGQLRECRAVDPPGKARRGAKVDGRTFVIREVTLPKLPLGYHQLELNLKSGIAKSLVIAAPARCYSEPGRSWGLFVPAYAVHSKKSWGAANLGDWQTLIRWLHGLGGQVAASLPLLAAFLDSPVCEPSPYSPASRLFWNEFYLDFEQVPEFSQCAAARKLVASAEFQQRLEKFRRSPQIDYAAQWSARREVLALLAEFFFKRASDRRREFDQFARARPELEDYARFRAACEQSGSSWYSWPERMREGGLRAGDFAESTKLRHAYAQWLAEEQMRQLRQSCSGMKLYLDLPLGVHPDSYDVWRHREAFALGASVGAPPDLFFSKGQDWGFAPPHPRQIRDQQYRYLREYLRFQMRHTNLLRIDHVMGLHRLYWIPKGLSARQGTYVSYPAGELYAILCLESHRNRTVLIGENLGTVPPEVNAGMDRHRLGQMYVLQYRQRPEARTALETPPVHCVASVNTHDMPTFAAHWRGLDLLDRAGLGIVPRRELPELRRLRLRLDRALIKFLGGQGSLKDGASPESARQLRRAQALPVLRACLRWLSASPAEILLINLEDLWEEEQPQNVPGTSSERPNWRRKTRLPLEDILNSRELRELLEEVHRLRGSAS